MTEAPNMDTTTIDDEQDGSALRKRLEATLEELAEERKVSRRMTMKAAGLNPDKGIGKAVMATYEGEWTEDALKAYATSEYDWAGTADEPVSKVDEEEKAKATDAAEKVEAGDTRTDETRAQSTDLDGQVTDQDRIRQLEAEVATARAEGDHEKANSLMNRAIALKTEQINPMRKG